MSTRNLVRATRTAALFLAAPAVMQRAMPSVSPRNITSVTDPLGALPEPLRSQARWTMLTCCRTPLPPATAPGSATPIGCDSSQITILAARVRAAGFPAAAAILQACADRRRVIEPSLDDWKNGFALGKADCHYKFPRVIGTMSPAFQAGYASGWASGGCR